MQIAYPAPFESNPVDVPGVIVVEMVEGVRVGNSKNVVALSMATKSSERQHKREDEFSNH